MKKKIFIVINSLAIGGSEKSLISLLNSIDYSQYEVDLMMFKKGEDFDIYIPKNVNILDEPAYYKFLDYDIYNLGFIKKIKYFITRLNTSLNLRINTNKKNRVNPEQILYKSQKNILDKINKRYDVAIAYSQGMPTYFIVDKVSADKKIAWINCDYKRTVYDKDRDYIFYKEVDNIIAVSKYGKKSIVSVNKEYEAKTEILMDIVAPKLIKSMADEEMVFLDKSYINICTVARLVLGYKGYDIAIKAAKLLKNSGYKFRWYAVGEGEDRSIIQKMIEELGLKEEFILLGKKINPYIYMKNCDIYVQPSRKEGFGLTVIEAKILKKLIVCTNFDTAREIINNEEDGLIVDIDENSLYLGIKRYLDNDKFKNKILNKLNNMESYNSLDEIEKLYKLINRN